MADHLQAALRDAGIDQLDARGLMPLWEARALVLGAKSFRKGEGRLVQGRSVLDSDRLWAALLSLADTEEFVREASRIRFFFQPRNQDTVAPLARYGEGILPWLASFVREGCLLNVPWCIRPCLLAIGQPEVFDLLASVRVVVDAASPGPGPFAVDSPGDLDACGCWPPDLGGCADDGSGAQLLLDWIYLHPEIGFPALIRRAAEDEPRALELLRAQCERWPADMLEWASEALGPERAEALFAAAGLARELSDEVVVALLDRYAAGRVAGRAWPVVTVDDPGWAFLGLRVVAVRSEDGDGWGLGFERLGGDREGALASLVLGYGSDAMGGVCHAASGPLAFFVEEREPGARQPGRLSLAGLRAVGPAGPLDLDDGMLAALDLRPGEWTTSAAPADPQLVLALRAYLGRFPDALWRPATELTEALGLEEQRPAILVDSKRFAHVEPWVDGTPPSGSVTFRSLARAIVQRDPSAFVPGIVNTDWRARLSRRAPQPSTSEEPKR